MDKTKMKVRQERCIGAKFKESLTLRVRVSCLTLNLNIEMGILKCTCFVRPETFSPQLSGMHGEGHSITKKFGSGFSAGQGG